MRCFCQLSINVVIQKSEALMKSSSRATLLMSADIRLKSNFAYNYVNKLFLKGAVYLANL